MTDTALQLVRETIDLTGAPAPELLDESAPTLTDSAPSNSADRSEPMYLVGLIGGKDVGKSALVNALVGRNITPQTSHGPGTETVVAYCHESQQANLRPLLEREVPGRYRIVPHANSRLSRQVLLDLPDIDSHFVDHLDVTRRMLRHMLFPIWVQSVEKYADAQPQKMLARVAAGNDPSNFLFCLNKVDQLDRSKGTQIASADPQPLPAEAIEIRDDYADRIAKLLSLPAAARVYLISATKPGRFDLPELAAVLTQQKTSAMVTESRRLAVRRRQGSLLAWLQSQDISGRADRIERLYDEAQEIAAQRIGVPIVEGAIPALLEDPAYRASMTEGVLAARVARWPLVNLVHALLSPLTYVIRENAAPNHTGAVGLVDSHLQSHCSAVSDLVQSAFAQLHQTHPAVADLYRERRLWESMPADSAAADLRTNLAETVERQRTMVMTRLAGHRGFVSPLFRWLLTIGAALWFPFIQPVLEAMLQPTGTRTLQSIGLIAVQILGVTPLLKTAAFLLIYYLALWAWLRWNTSRKVSRLLSRWKTADESDESLNLTTQTLHWLQRLLEPIESNRQRVENLAGRISEFRLELEGEKPAQKRLESDAAAA